MNWMKRVSQQVPQNQQQLSPIDLLNKYLVGELDADSLRDQIPRMGLQARDQVCALLRDTANAAQNNHNQALLDKAYAMSDLCMNSKTRIDGSTPQQQQQMQQQQQQQQQNKPLFPAGTVFPELSESQGGSNGS